MLFALIVECWSRCNIKESKLYVEFLFAQNTRVSVSFMYITIQRCKGTTERTHCEWNMFVYISFKVRALACSITHSCNSVHKQKILVRLVKREKSDNVFVSLFTCITYSRFCFFYVSEFNWNYNHYFPRLNAKIYYQINLCIYIKRIILLAKCQFDRYISLFYVALQLYWQPIFLSHTLELQPWYPCIHATNNRVLKEHRLISLIARRRRVCNSISKPVGLT